MTLVDLFGLLVPASFLALLAVEALAPARALPRRRGWRWLGFGFLVMMALVSTLLPLLIPPSVVARYQVFDLSSLGTVGGFAVGWVVYSFIGFVWHRAVHAISPLWRAFHQLHHAPTRLDVASSSVFHPTEAVAYTAITVLTTVFLLGLSPEAGAVVGFWAAFVSFFQHANIRTPQWLGYLVQRPEAHGLHHLVGGPAGNYADLPLWDILFGSFHNPARFDGEVGFPGGADRRWGAMLAFVDVNAGTPAAQPATAPRTTSELLAG